MIKSYLVLIDQEDQDYLYKQTAPFYGFQEVSEDDPNFLLKMLTLEPPETYVPTFLTLPLPSLVCDQSEESEQDLQQELMVSLLLEEDIEAPL